MHILSEGLFDIKFEQNNFGLIDACAKQNGQMGFEQIFSMPWFKF